MICHGRTIPSLHLIPLHSAKNLPTFTTLHSAILTSSSHVLVAESSPVEEVLATRACPLCKLQEPIFTAPSVCGQDLRMAVCTGWWKADLCQLSAGATGRTILCSYVPRMQEGCYVQCSDWHCCGGGLGDTTRSADMGKWQTVHIIGGMSCLENEPRP